MFASLLSRVAAVRLRWKILLAFVVIFAIWLTFAISTLSAARSDAQDAADKLQLWRSETDVASMLDGEVDEQLTSALGDLTRANDRVNSALLAPARLTPILSTQVKSMEMLTAAGRDVVATAIDGQKGIIAATDLYELNGDRLALLEEIAAISTRTANTLGTVDLGPEDGLLGPLPGLREQVVEQIEEAVGTADDAVVVTSAIAEFLRGPSTYLLLGTNNAEMRVGSGTVLSIGKLVASDGEIEISDFVDVDAVPISDPFESSDADLEANWGWLEPTSDWRNLAVSGRFDLTARTAAAMWQIETGEKVDGVMAIDPVALSRLVEASGPIELDSITYDSSGLLFFLLAGQYQQFESQYYPAEGEEDLLYLNIELPEFTEAQVVRQTTLASLVASVAGNVTGSSVDIEVFADELLGLAESRHLLLWSSDPTEQQAWRAAGVSGELDERSLMVSLLNRGANKLDYFTSVDADLSVTATPDVLGVELAVRATNNTPDGLRKNQIGPNIDLEDDPLAFGEYFGVVVVTLPGAASNIGVAEGQVLANGPDGDNHVVALRARVKRGEAATWTISFDLPASENLVVMEPSARLDPTVYAGGGFVDGDDIRHEVDLEAFIAN